MCTHDRFWTKIIFKCFSCHSTALKRNLYFVKVVHTWNTYLPSSNIYKKTMMKDHIDSFISFPVVISSWSVVMNLSLKSSSVYNFKRCLLCNTENLMPASIFKYNEWPQIKKYCETIFNTPVIILDFTGKVLLF